MLRVIPTRDTRTEGLLCSQRRQEQRNSSWNDRPTTEKGFNIWMLTLHALYWMAKCKQKCNMSLA